MAKSRSADPRRKPTIGLSTRTAPTFTATLTPEATIGATMILTVTRMPAWAPPYLFLPAELHLRPI
jgi:hypothetical protein